MPLKYDVTRKKNYLFCFELPSLFFGPVYQINIKHFKRYTARLDSKIRMKKLPKGIK